MLRLIYLAHPFGGEQENVDAVEKIVKGMIHKHPDCTFYSPLHATGFMYSQLTYLGGMEHCFEALSRCDELWLCGSWQDSRGCNMEYGFAKAKGMPVKFFLGRDCNGRCRMTRIEILQTAIDIYGVSAQEDMLLEEMAELQKAVLKLRRADAVDKSAAMGYPLREAILEEIADVQIMLDQMRLIYGATAEQEVFKLERLEKRLEG